MNNFNGAVSPNTLAWQQQQVFTPFFTPMAQLPGMPSKQLLRFHESSDVHFLQILKYTSTVNELVRVYVLKRLFGVYKKYHSRYSPSHPHANSTGDRCNCKFYCTIWRTSYIRTYSGTSQ